MSSKSTQRKCRCCKKFFTPDRHNPSRHLFCSAPDCRRASKAASQRRWLNKPANRDYFRGPANVERVRQWRQAHPDYWKRSKSQSKPNQLTDPQPLKPGTTSCNVPQPEVVALQDLALTEHPAFVGLISLISGSTLQEDIASIGRRLLLQGKNILGLQVQQKTPPHHDSQTTAPP